ncbi:MAG: glycosyl transferase [Chloroflexota bacterium]
MRPKRVAIVHDWLNQHGGAERVLEVLHDLFPDAPIYTSIFDPKAMPPEYRRWKVVTSFMQALPGVARHHQWYLPLYPLAFDSFDLAEFDLVISNSSGFCHGVLVRADACHVNYCLTPPRFLWNFEAYVEREAIGPVLRALLRPLISLLRLWDAAAAQRVDFFIGISRAVVARIRRVYRRDAWLLHPPVETDRFRPADRFEDYFLVVSRLVPYKRVDLAVEAANRLRVPLLVVGDGRDRPRLERMAGPTVKFLGRLRTEQVAELMSRSRALIFPGEEDFGIVPVEAMASGRPVIAYAAGGALDTVIEGRTGVLFREQTADTLAEVLAAFRPEEFDPAALRAFARQFDTAEFKRKFLALVERAMASSGPTAPGVEAELPG